MRNTLLSGKRHTLTITVFILSALCAGVFFLSSETVVSSVSSSLRFCASHVIPAVFPYSVLSSFIIYTGGMSVIERVFSRVFYRIFGIKAGASALLAGLLFGFPLGAATAGALTRRGLISPRECSRILCFTCTASPAFPVFVVGVACLRNIRAGIFIWCAQAAVSVLYGAVLNLLCPLRSEYLPDIKINPDIKQKRLPDENSSIAVMLTKSVADASRVMLSVCGSVTFFSLLSNIIIHFIPEGVTPILPLAVRAVFEFATGSAAAAQALSYGYINYAGAMFFSGFAVGFSGLSVICQNTSVCPDNIDILPHIISKLVCGVVTGALSALYITVSDTTLTASVISVASLRPSLQSVSARFGITVLIIIVYIFYIKRKKQIYRR